MIFVFLTLDNVTQAPVVPDVYESEAVCAKQEELLSKLPTDVEKENASVDEDKDFQDSGLLPLTGR